MDLCLRIGEMLLSSGAGAADVTATMRSVADHLGLRQAEIDVTFTALSMSYQRSLDDVPMLMMRHVQQRDIDYEDLTAVDHLVRDILTDQADLYLARVADGDDRLARPRLPALGGDHRVGRDGRRGRRLPRRRARGVARSRPSRRRSSTGCRS